MKCMAIAVLTNLIGIVGTGGSGPVSGQAPAGVPPESAHPVRVMSFNIRYGTANDGENHWNERKTFLVDTILAFDPDLLGTQETLAAQRDFLVKHLAGYEVFGAGRDDGKDGGEMAALFFRKARFEKIDGGHLWLSDTPEKVGSKGWDAALPRIATWVKLKDRTATDALPVFFLNTHFDHRGTRARLESARLIRKAIDDLGKDCRVIITGDFNSGEGSDPYQALFGDLDSKPSKLVDTFRVRQPKRSKDEGTFSEFKASAVTGARIDWIACSRDWDIRLAGIDRTERAGRTPSDHFPVTAVLRATVPHQQPQLRVLTYNIHHGEGTDQLLDLHRLAKVIRAADADIVALQEVDDRTKRSVKIDQTAVLEQLTGLNGTFGKAIDHQGGGYGQAVLSRFPLGKPTVHPLPGQAERERRIALEVPLTIDGQELRFVSTHLDHQLATERDKQVAKLNELFANTDEPTILAGDLNDTPDSKALATLSTKWKLATATPSLMTFPSGKPTQQLDYVLYRPSQMFRVLDARVLNEPLASDHRPVLVLLEWPLK